MVKSLGGKSLLNKKGSLVDLIFIVVGLLIFAITTLIGFTIVSAYNDNIAANPYMAAEAITSTQSLTNMFPGVIDGSFLILAIGMAIAAFIMASLVRVHPIFLPFFLIALVFLIFFAGVFSNVYQTMAANAVLSVHADKLIFISNILTYLPFIVGIFGSALSLIMYKLWSNSQL